MAKAKNEAIVVKDVQSFVTRLDVNYVTADSIGLTFDTMPGNQPSNYGNYVAIWQNQNMIPWNQDPLKKQQITKNTQRGSANFTDLDLAKNSYIVGYSVGPEKAAAEGPKFGNICSTAFVPTQAKETVGEYPTFQTNLILQYVGIDSVAVQFLTPAGYKPATNKNWMGLWRGEVASYINPPDWSTPITLDTNRGTAGFNNVSIGRGLIYTIGYFMGGWLGAGQANKQGALACSVTFVND